MAWHSTGRREELLVMLTGRVSLEVRQDARLAIHPVMAGQCIFLPRRVEHRVVNRAAIAAQYLYVTG